MRGLGAFQRGQMRDSDPRVHDFFNHVRQAIDVLEQIFLHPHRGASSEAEETAPVEVRASAAPVLAGDPKLSYTVKEVRKLVGISNTTLYRAIGNGELRSVKFGHKTLILAKDLQAWLDSLPAMR